MEHRKQRADGSHVPMLSGGVLGGGSRGQMEGRAGTTTGIVTAPLQVCPASQP